MRLFPLRAGAVNLLAGKRDSDCPRLVWGVEHGKELGRPALGDCQRLKDALVYAAKGS
jgi:hypothetical protein